ncbi:MAG: YkgJ family cysteine cluster protein [Candidatus Diapherotrites archaeon]|nr:YkgJ family cysteine cluster protein [Candidatus Diapherotrites archaeon]
MNWLTTCVNCNVKCCCRGFDAILSNKEIKAIKAKGYRNFARNNVLKKVKGKCVFSDKGKCLIQEIKPLSCKIYPVIFDYFPTLKKDKFIFYMDLSCPQALNIPKEWIEEQKTMALKELRKWNKKEIEIYCYRP